MTKKTPRIYLDVCCLCRPFDFQGDYRIRLESEAIMILLSKVEEGEFELISSEAIDFEVGKIPENDKRYSVSLMRLLAKKKIILTEKLFTRAEHLEKLGITAVDALHIACAEEGEAIFLTVDNKLGRKAKKMRDLKIDIYNVLDFLNIILEDTL